jgi:hypothetical protein
MPCLKVAATPFVVLLEPIYSSDYEIYKLEMNERVKREEENPIKWNYLKMIIIELYK